MALERGTRLGPYEIQAAIGAGGMGEVYRARDTRLDRSVAVKVLPSRLASDSVLRERFDREARAISHLSHPNICALYDVGQTPVATFLVLEYLQGETLADRLKRGPLSISSVLAIAIQVAEALKEAHRQGVVHRDLKPANIMLVSPSVLSTSDARADEPAQPVVKLLDFGLAKLVPESSSPTADSVSASTRAALTSEGAILGTYQYMAPEQLRGQEATAATDAWAFGCVLREMVIGRDVRARASVKPRSLNRLIDRCLSPTPEGRPTAVELERGLHSVQRRLPWRRPIAIASAAAGFLLLAVAVAWSARLWPRPDLRPLKPVTILIADFDNQTNEAVFDGTVEHALGLALEDSRLVSLYSRREAQAIAALIESGARLDERMSRLVAQREGTGLVLAGVVAPEQGGYLISAHLVDPRRGIVVATETERAHERSQSLPAIGRLGQSLRRALGERDLTRDSLPSDETFTTSSLEAAREYVIAQKLLDAGHYDDAVAHYQKALEFDPKLGRAHSGWAVAEHYLGRPDDARAQMAKSLELLPRMSRHEQLRTQGLNAGLFEDDTNRAVAVYEQLLQQYPGDTAARNNLAVMKFMLLDFDAARAAGASLAGLFPKSFLYRSNLALYEMYAGHLAAAAEEARQSIALNPRASTAYLPLAVNAAYEGKLDEASRVYDTMAEGDARAQRLATICLADLHVYAGDLQRARERLVSGVAADLAARSTTSAALKHLLLAEVELLEGNRQNALTAVREATRLASEPTIRFRAAIIFLDVGIVGEATRLIGELPSQPQGFERWSRLIADARVAAQQGGASGATLLERELEKGRGPWLAYLAAARMRLQTGDAAAALKHIAWCLDHLPEGAAAYLDDVPTLRYWADAWYLSGLTNEMVGDATAARTAYTNFLTPRRDAHDARTEDARRRLSKLSGLQDP